MKVKIAAELTFDIADFEKKSDEEQDKIMDRILSGMFYGTDEWGDIRSPNTIYGWISEEDPDFNKDLIRDI